MYAIRIFVKEHLFIPYNFTNSGDIIFKNGEYTDYCDDRYNNVNSAFKARERIARLYPEYEYVVEDFKDEISDIQD